MSRSLVTSCLSPFVTFFLPSPFHSPFSPSVCQAGECPADNTPTDWLYFPKVFLGLAEASQESQPKWEREGEKKIWGETGRLALSGT